MRGFSAGVRCAGPCLNSELSLLPMNRKSRIHRIAAPQRSPEPSAPRAEVVVGREAAVLIREQSVLLREELAGQRERALFTVDEDSKAKVELVAETAAQLREANEHLTLATLRAQTMSDAAEEAILHMRAANERLATATARAEAMTVAAEQAVTHMAYAAQHDFLTGLPNRSLLTDLLSTSMALAQRHGKKVALMYLDLDHFKNINDSLGHTVGDQLLQSIAKRLRASIRLSDTVCRQGGDEFVVLMPDIATVQDAMLKARKLILAMAEPFYIGSHTLHITLSIGISLYPDDGGDIETVVRNADMAMYHAKISGRNNYQVFTPDMNTRAVSRQSVEVTLYHALQQDEFVLHYQPKVNIQTGAITGAEALVRLQQPHQPIAYPMDFVGVAEDCGLILPLGRWILREACRQTAAWLQEGLGFGLMAVNVSAVEFHGKDFLAGVRAILDETGLDPHHLELELTESGLMHDTDVTKATLMALKGLGVQIAIDDFGTGYSSLSYLRRFPIDTLKIDQSFMHGINGDSEDATIVSAIIALGKSLKQRVVAEGVETRHQLAFLREQGCEEGQGYLFSRPVSAQKFASVLAASRH